METRQIAVILLIVAIIFSLVSIVLSSGLDLGEFRPVGCSAENVECVGDTGSASGNIGLQVIAPPEGTE